MAEKLTPDPKKGGRTFTPTRSYDLKITIDDLDYTQDTIVVQFVSSLATAYQSVSIVFELDPNDVILQQLYGGSSIKLAITLLREEQYPGPRIDLDLMFIGGGFHLNEKDKVSTNADQQKDRGYYSIMTVLRQPYKIMNTLVNDVFVGTSIGQMIFELATSAGAKKIQVDRDGQNTQPIDQVCIPPTTLYKVLKEYNSNAINPFDGFIDQRFGIFDGVPGIFCQYDGTVNIKNLTAKMQKNPAFIIYQIATDMDVDEWDLMLKEVSDDKTFYTYSTIATDYTGNAKFAKIGSNINHIVKPKDKLSQTITQDLKTVAAKYSIIYKNKNLDVDVAALRKRYFIQDTGDETNQTIFNSRISRRVADLSTLTIDLERNLPVLNLIEVGECVKFKPKTVEYADFEGKYILWSTDISFRRENNWQTTAQVKLMRTNKRAGETVKPKADLTVLPSAAESARELERLSRGLNNPPKETLDSLTAGQTVEQVIQSANKSVKLYQGTPPEILEEIQSNQQKIIGFQEQVDKFEEDCEFSLSSRGVCSPRANRFNKRQIIKLQKRNAELAIKSRFS